ncbi:MAG: hypothetical protein IKD37_03925 [Clostridia bacterium]|nr:hypothetical protein [Clostridia bacterium]
MKIVKKVAIIFRKPMAFCCDFVYNDDESCAVHETARRNHRKKEAADGEFYGSAERVC